MEKILRKLFEEKEVFLLPIMVGVMAASFYPVITESSSISENKETLVLAIGSVTAFMAVVMARFLSGSSRSTLRESREVWLYKEFRTRIKELEKERSLLLEGEKNELADAIKSRLIETTTEDYLSEIKEKLKESEFKLEIAKRMKGTLERIYNEIDALGRRGTVNLILGVITALSGVLALSFFVLFNEGGSKTPGEFAMEFLPRLSIVVIIEVFSYFFLKLYKSSLSEIKYFQNEATNIEYSFVALETALKVDDSELVKQCVNKMLHTERNPILNGDQTTRELKDSQLDGNSLPLTPDYLVKIIEAIKTEKNT
ncbi:MULTISPECIES: hypothetical protein [unclassified Pseudoalteromonas]|uniref:hypothetical protein n=1 Tax=unclassified Pseudoalteromonas TaxID=194690 RepID=UPI0020971376|nr:hypothetical protein [Pseudoalteromonas sp. XMcav2-N]MCO7188394.1 hypothetical protein [Pseudoalteromonas sp. XMcav2-N]